MPRPWATRDRLTLVRRLLLVAALASPPRQHSRTICHTLPGNRANTKCPVHSRPPNTRRRPHLPHASQLRDEPTGTRVRPTSRNPSGDTTSPHSIYQKQLRATRPACTAPASSIAPPA